MKAAVYYENGGPDVLCYEDVADPPVGPMDVLIQVEAISLEGGDILNRRSVPPPSFPHIVGYQAGGTVLATGSDVSRFAVGQRVACFNWAGSHAALLAAPEDQTFAVPDGLDIATAAAIPVTFGTAHDALFEFGHLQAGETVLVQGAAGGVGLAAVQLAKAAGAIVIGTASGEDRVQRVRELGADHVIDYRTSNVAAVMREITNGYGVDLMVDMVGGASSRALLSAIRYRGRVAVVGFASGEMNSFNFLDIVPRALTVMGVIFGKEMGTPRAHTLINACMTDIAQGRFTMPIDRTFSLSEAAAAHRHVEEGHPFGRVLMVP